MCCSAQISAGHGANTPSRSRSSSFLAKPSIATVASGTPRGTPLGAIAEGAEVKDMDIDRTTLNRIVKWHEGAEPEEWKFWRSLGMLCLFCLMFHGRGRVGRCVCVLGISHRRAGHRLSHHSCMRFFFFFSSSSHTVWQSWSRVVGLLPLTHMPIVEKEFFKQLEDHRKKDSGNLSSTFGMFLFPFLLE